jgi:mannosyl-oligosaccharide glucosidase
MEIICWTETRHACDLADGLDSYTWKAYDAREGGVQVLKDSKNNVEITTEFLKVAGGDNGGSWAARIKGKPITACVLENKSLPVLD